MTVPSAKTCRNMPNWLPSLERPSASRVRSGIGGRDRRADARPGRQAAAPARRRPAAAWSRAPGAIRRSSRHRRPAPSEVPRRTALPVGRDRGRRIDGRSPARWPGSRSSRTNRRPAGKVGPGTPYHPPARASCPAPGSRAERSATRAFHDFETIGDASPTSLPVRIHVLARSVPGTSPCPVRLSFRTRRRGKPPPPSSCLPGFYRPRCASRFAFPGRPRPGAGRPWGSAGRSGRAAPRR